MGAAPPGALEPGMTSPRRLAVLLVLVAACSSSRSPAGPSQLPDEGDARMLQRVLAGTLAPAEGLQRVAASGGWRPDLAAASTTLIVGIDNTSSRFAEYTHVPDSASVEGAWGDAYADFVEQVVRPFVEAL